ncbi:MAG: ATP-binding cassette domain-containing protein, partial [Anaerolineae bacterium]
SGVLGYEDPYYQMRWNSVKGRGTFTVSEYLSEQHIDKRNPYEVVETHHDPVVFMTCRGQVIELLGIAGLLDRNLVSISNGERRKVQIARALLKQPQLLILDNPFEGLDQDFRKRFRAIVKALMQDGLRVIVVATDVEDIPEGITHVLAVDEGTVVAQKTIDDFTEATWSANHSNPLKSVRSVEMDFADSPVIEMRNVTIIYDTVRVLDNITWTVRKGERWALLGPNGAGKTTLLSLILGDNPQAYANDIALFGRRRGSGESIWDIKQRIGWIAPELHMYYPRHVSSFDVVCSGFFDAIGRYRRCTAEQHEVAHTWMQRLDTARYAEARFGTLSEGEQRMVLLTRALVKSPELLVLDEPCQGLDAQNRTRIIRTVENIGQHLNVTLIYVTHDVDELPESITHRVYLQQGKVVMSEGL